jgi:hypothetical protein
MGENMPTSKKNNSLERTRTVSDSLLESDVINGMRTGELPSPTRLGNSLYYRMRMTGTGAVWRSDGGDTFRDPSKYINQEFVSACIGIPLVMDHPESGRIGPDDKIIGTTVAAYTYSTDGQSPEVWVIARVIDGYAQEALLTEVLSTSPSVIVGDSPDGFSEGAPLVIDHLAVVPQGVWDMGGPPVGIDQQILINDSQSTNEVSNMTPDQLDAHIEALVTQKLQAALAAHSAKTEADSATDLNPPAVAPQAVMADETTQTHGVTDPGHSHSISDPGHSHGVTMPDCEPGSTGSQTVADAEVKADYSAEKAEEKVEVKADSEDMVDSEVKPDSDEAPKGEDGKPEVKADADEASKDEPKTETKADDAEPVADSDEEDEMTQNSQLAALQAQVEVLTKALAGQSTLSDAEAAEMGAARLHADAAMRGAGKPAMQPFPGEKVMAYRKRVINELKCHSTTLKDADVSTIADSASLSLIEKQVFADAAAYARSGAGIPQGQLVGNKRVTETGHTVTEYNGSVRAWTQETDLPAKRAFRV